MAAGKTIHLATIALVAYADKIYSGAPAPLGQLPAPLIQAETHGKGQGRQYINGMIA
jgi:hypothetical protein